MGLNFGFCVCFHIVWTPYVQKGLNHVIRASICRNTRTKTFDGREIGVSSPDVDKRLKLVPYQQRSNGRML